MITLDQTGDGPPLVLLHGVGTNRTVWRQVTPGLSRSHAVLAPDLPGFGRSDPAGRGFDLARVADAVADGVRDRVDQRFALLGSSLGGAVAVVLADRHPELVHTLVLAAPAGFTPRAWPVAVAAGSLMEPMMRARRVLGAPLADVGVARRGLLWGAVADPARMGSDDARAMLASSRGARRMGGAVSTVLRTDLSPVLARLDVPLGVLWGRRDGIVPIGVMDRVRAVRPDVAVETLRDAGHVPQLELPRAFVAAVTRLLARLAG